MSEGRMEALGYARAACDTIMRKYEAEKLPPVDRFHYHQGVFLSGMNKIYSLTGNADYSKAGLIARLMKMGILKIMMMVS